METETDFFGLSITYGIQSKDLILGKEYSFINHSWPNSHFTGIGTVKEIFESTIRGTTIVFHKVSLVYMLDYHLDIDPRWELGMPISEIQMELTEKQQARDLLERVQPMLPLEVLDIIFQMLDFQDLEKLKERMDIIIK